MKLISTLALLLFTITLANAQSVTAEFYSDGQASNNSEFPLHEGLLAKSGDTYLFGTENQIRLTNPVSFSISDGLNMIGALQFNEGLTCYVYNYKGQQMLNSNLEFADPSDETLQLLTLDSGEFIVRDNVANFSFFEATGERQFTYSNSSQAPGGEQPSQISVSNDGVLKVAYNPVIQYDNNRGSRISIITGDRHADEIFVSQNQIITHLSVSSQDHSISVITEDGSGSKKIHWFDRFGNLLFEMEPEMDLSGFTISNGGEFITLYSGSRVQVYRIENSERVGSATSRSSIVQASYFPKQNLILSLGGQIQNQRLSNLEITAIDIQQRQIDRTHLDGTITFLDQSKIEINRGGSGNYSIDGINRPILVRAQF